MTFETVATWIFAGALCAAALAVFPFRRWALRNGMVDHPDKVRKLHKEPVAVGGGVVIFLVMTAFMTTLVYCQGYVGFKLNLSPKLLLPLIIVSPLIILVGLVDDLRGISGKIKLLAQILTATIIIGFAKCYSVVTCFGVDLDLHHLFYPLAIFWVVGMINAINLLDGADGTAVSVSFLMSLATAGMAYVNEHLGVSLVALGLAGCLAGFFLHNRPAAKVYLGDTGSMFIGLVLATLMLRACVESERTISICGPLAIVLIPVVDSFFAVVRRINSGRTIFSPDRGHIHHLLSIKFSSSWLVLLTLNLLVLPGCIAAVVGVYYRNDVIPTAVSAFVLAVAIGADLFGRRELSIMLGRAKGRFRKWFHKKKYMSKNGEIYHIQGRGPWRTIWHRLVILLQDYPCRQLQLSINMPSRNEDFFGEWENISKNSDFQPLDCSVPLMAEETHAGTLRLLFESRHADRDVLLTLASQLSAICEISIARYLQSGALDESFTALSFDSALADRMVREARTAAETTRGVGAKRVA